MKEKKMLRYLVEIVLGSGSRPQDVEAAIVDGIDGRVDHELLRVSAVSGDIQHCGCRDGKLCEWHIRQAAQARQALCPECTAPMGHPHSRECSYPARMARLMQNAQPISEGE